LSYGGPAMLKLREARISTPRGNRTPATSVKGWRAYRYTMGAGLKVYGCRRPGSAWRSRTVRPDSGFSKARHTDVNTDPRNSSST
jgi:hypothetical protein